MSLPIDIPGRRDRSGDAAPRPRRRKRSSPHERPVPAATVVADASSLSGSGACVDSFLFGQPDHFVSDPVHSLPATLDGLVCDGSLSDNFASEPESADEDCSGPGTLGTEQQPQPAKIQDHERGREHRRVGQQPLQSLPQPRYQQHRPQQQQHAIDGLSGSSLDRAFLLELDHIRGIIPSRTSSNNSSNIDSRSWTRYRNPIARTRGRVSRTRGNDRSGGGPGSASLSSSPLAGVTSSQEDSNPFLRGSTGEKAGALLLDDAEDVSEEDAFNDEMDRSMLRYIGDLMETTERSLHKLSYLDLAPTLPEEGLRRRLVEFVHGVPAAAPAVLDDGYDVDNDNESFDGNDLYTREEEEEVGAQAQAAGKDVDDDHEDDGDDPLDFDDLMDASPAVPRSVSLGDFRPRCFPSSGYSHRHPAPPPQQQQQNQQHRYSNSGGTPRGFNSSHGKAATAKKTSNFPVNPQKRREMLSRHRQRQSRTSDLERSAERLFRRESEQLVGLVGASYSSVAAGSAAGMPSVGLSAGGGVPSLALMGMHGFHVSFLSAADGSGLGFLPSADMAAGIDDPSAAPSLFVAGLPTHHAFGRSSSSLASTMSSPRVEGDIVVDCGGTRVSSGQACRNLVPRSELVCQTCLHGGRYICSTCLHEDIREDALQIGRYLDLKCKYCNQSFSADDLRRIMLHDPDSFVTILVQIVFRLLSRLWIHRSGGGPFRLVELRHSIMIAFDADPSKVFCVLCCATQEECMIKSECLRLASLAAASRLPRSYAHLSRGMVSTQLLAYVIACISDALAVRWYGHPTAICGEAAAAPTRPGSNPHQQRQHYDLGIAFPDLAEKIMTVVEDYVSQNDVFVPSAGSANLVEDLSQLDCGGTDRVLQCHVCGSVGLKSIDECDDVECAYCLSKLLPHLHHRHHVLHEHLVLRQHQRSVSQSQQQRRRPPPPPTTERSLSGSKIL